MSYQILKGNKKYGSELEIKRDIRDSHDSEILEFKLIWYQIDLLGCSIKGFLNPIPLHNLYIDQIINITMN